MRYFSIVLLSQSLTLRFWAAAGVSALAAIGLGASTAAASGNAIPDPAARFGKPARDRIAERLPYRGAVGRVSRPFVRAAMPQMRGGYPTEQVVVGRDAACRSPKLASVASGRAPSRDDYIVLLIFPTRAVDERVKAIALAPADQKASLESAAREVERFELIRVAPNVGVTPVVRSEEAGEFDLEVEYPDVAALAVGDFGYLNGDLRIVVLPAAKPVPFRRLMQSCADVRDDRSFAPLICIDTFYSDAEDRCGTSMLSVHEGACHLIGGGKRTRFKDQCYPGPGAGEHPARCSGTPIELEYRVNRCGAVVVDFDWRGILDAGGSVGPRRLRLKTAAARSAAGAGAMRIPGTEFLASYPAAPKETTKPEDRIAPLPSGRLTQELAVEGLATSAEAVVYAYPRMKVARLCTQGRRKGEACMTVDGTAPVCACDDPLMVECVCASVSARDAAYAHCASSRERDGMPCTRAAHCSSDRRDRATCMPGAVCVDRGAVWYPGAPMSGTPCRNDRDCFAENKQCGYRLFEFRDSLPDGRGRLRAAIGEGDQGRGVCEHVPVRACDGQIGCDPGQGRCMGYRLEALGRAAPGGFLDPGGAATDDAYRAFQTPPDVIIDRGGAR